MTTPTSTPKFYALEKSDNGEATIHLYDEVGAFGSGSKEFLADLARLDGQHIHLRINSPGGSVVEGTAIYNALRRHKGGLTVHIDALAASMASVIAMAGAPVYIADNALLMIHNPWTVSAGDSDQLRREADLLDKLKDSLRNAYVRKTGMEADRIAEMMDQETWLDAVEAVALGFADAIEEGVAAAATATPAQLRARFDKFAQGMTQPETQEPAAPEVLEEPAATVVSESADSSTPSDSSDSTEPAAEQPAEVEPTPEPEQPAPAEPQARATAADAILAKYNEVIARAEAAEAHAKAIEAKLDLVKGELATKCEDLDRLERSLGLSPARIVPAVDQAQDSGSIYDQWKNSTGADKTRIFRANRKALEAHAKLHGV
jgi:ATP-dependent Clp endopeptidase proteolytic subunit ClpP